MNIDQAISAARAPINRLKVDLILEQLDTGDAKTLRTKYLEDSTVPAAQIARALTRLGYSVSADAVVHWRQAYVVR